MLLLNLHMSRDILSLVFIILFLIANGSNLIGLLLALELEPRETLRATRVGKDLHQTG